MDLPHSDAPFFKAYPAEVAEASCEGHVAAFAFFGMIPQSILYDNTKLAVAQILGDGKRSCAGTARALPKGWLTILRRSWRCRRWRLIRAIW